MVSFLDSLVYAFLSFSHVWILFALLMLFLRRRKFRAVSQSRERGFYWGLFAISMIAWVWNGLRPTPSLFEERVGLYWGIKLENASWMIHTGGYRGQPIIAYCGRTSLAVQFQKVQGWVIFHHFPTAPQVGRYEALEFHVLNNDLKSDSLLLAVYSDGKISHPPNGLALIEEYQCKDKVDKNGWSCYRVPLDDFRHPGGGLIGIAFGKGNGVDQGVFYLDEIHLIKKPRP